jgi:hypothetical protein
MILEKRERKTVQEILGHTGVGATVEERGQCSTEEEAVGFDFLEWGNWGFC